MNSAVACYLLLLATSVVLAGVSLQKYHMCYWCGVPRNHKPTMLSAFIATAWSVVACNGLWVKWNNEEARLTIDTPMLVLLIIATLFTLAYSLSATHRLRGTVQ